MIGKQKTKKKSTTLQMDWMLIQSLFIKDVLSRLSVSSLILLSRWLLSMPSKSGDDQTNYATPKLMIVSMVNQFDFDLINHLKKNQKPLDHSISKQTAEILKVIHTTSQIIVNTSSSGGSSTFHDNNKSHHLLDTFFYSNVVSTFNKTCSPLCSTQILTNIFFSNSKIQAQFTVNNI
jgi:hypothetical protein